MLLKRLGRAVLEPRSAIASAIRRIPAFAEREHLRAQIAALEQAIQESHRQPMLTQPSRYGEPKRALSDWDLVSLLPLDVGRRAFINGFPGAGNVITHHLYLGIVDSQKRLSKTMLRHHAHLEELTQATHFIGPRYETLLGILKAALPETWNGVSYFQHRGAGAQDFLATNAEKFLLLTDIDLGIHLNSVSHSTHELPSLANYRAFAAAGFTMFPIVRHPLDLLVSFASKDNLSEEHRRAIVNVSPNPNDERRRAIAPVFRRFACRLRLADDAWLAGAVDAIKVFHAPIATMAADYSPVRYEDILSDPIKFVDDMSRRVEMPIMPDHLRSISSIVGTKEFRPGHLNNPSSGKWRQYFSRRQIDIVRSSGLFEIFQIFGYPSISVDEAMENVSDANSDRAQLDTLAPGLSNLLPDPIVFSQYLTLASTFDPLSHADRFGIRNHLSFIHHGRHLLVSNSRPLLESYSQRLSNLILERMGVQ